MGKFLMFYSAPEGATVSQLGKRGLSNLESLQQAGINEDKARSSISPANDMPMMSSRSGRWKWLIPLLITCALVALGGGIGIGYVIGNMETPVATPMEPTKTVTVTSTATSTATPTGTPIPSNTAPVLDPASTEVQRGVVGIANFDCTNDKRYQSPYGEGFTQLCDISYPAGTDVRYDDSAVFVNDIYVTTTYTFQSCMDICAQYNARRISLQGYDSIECAAVSYNANLTYWFENATPGATLAGNCYLKDARGQGSLFDEEDRNYALIASAYLTSP